jgi:hypothetical protein
MDQIRIARNEKLPKPPSSSAKSKASTFFHNSYNSSIKGAMYTSILAFSTDSFPRINKVTLKKTFLCLATEASYNLEGKLAM